MGRRLRLLLRAPNPLFALPGGRLVPPWPEKLLAEAMVGHLLLVGVGVPRFEHSGGPAQTRGEANVKHTCGCPRCVVHYETCIQSLMAQVQDLRAQSLELQRYHQELSQAVASTAGISQSYGDRMTQILSTLAKLDAVVQGYQQNSKGVAASESDHF